MRVLHTCGVQVSVNNTTLLIFKSLLCKAEIVAIPVPTALYFQLVQNCPFPVFDSCYKDEQKSLVSGDRVIGHQQGCP